ncbi:MAG: hypothetical protein J5819_06615 [Eubacterium sp.]|nr:hypothetical protein [Eubacterium sp.]
MRKSWMKNKKYLIRLTALVLSLVLVVGTVGISPTVSSAKSDDDEIVIRVVNDDASTAALKTAMAKYGLTYVTGMTDDQMREALGNMLLGRVSSLLKMSIKTTEFQDAFLALQGVYNELNSDVLAVVPYTRTMEQQASTAYLDMYTKLITLYDYSLNALRAIYNANNIPRSNENLNTFFNSLYDGDGSAFKRVKIYVDQFDHMSTYELLIPCMLGGDVKNRDAYRYYMLTEFPMDVSSPNLLTKFNFTVSDGSTTILPAMGATTANPLTYYALYTRLMNEYRIQKAYSNMHYTTASTEPIRGYMNAFEAALSEDGMSGGLYSVYDLFCKPVSAGGLGSQGDADAFIRLLFNGSEILGLINEYKDLKGFLSALDALSPNPKSKEEVARAIDVNNKYLALTASEKNKLSADDLKKLEECIPAKTSIENVVNLINAIKYPTTETEYKTVFLPAYQKAETAYNALLTQYPNMGIESFVDNRTLLTDDYATFKAYEERIFEVLAIPDANVCNKLATVITPLRTELQNLSKTKPSVFNHLIGYSSLETMYNDATTAKKLRDRVDVLMLSPTSDDTKELNSIKSAVSSLNAKAKAYFGTLYEQYIQALEYGTYTDDLNLANRVDTLIGRIGTVTANSGAKIEAARSAYNSLTDLQKSLVKSYNTLVAAEATYAQLSQDISYASVTNIKTGYVYTHSAIEPLPVVKINGVTLSKGVHYNVSYSDNLNVGTATVIITTIDGSGYKGTYKKTFLIVRDGVDNCGVSNLKTKYKYTGKKIKPDIKVNVNGFTLKKGTDYKLKYSNNKNPGTASIKITGIGNYKGSRTVTFKIYKKKKKKK